MNFNKIKTNCHGQSLIEIIIAMAIFSLTAGYIGSLILGSLDLLTESDKIQKARGLAEEGIEAVRSIRDRAWNEMIYNTSAVAEENDIWTLAGESSTEQIDKFTRTINFYPLRRNSDGEITTEISSSTYEDVETKRIEAIVEWPIRNGSISSVVRNIYLSNWRSTDWGQTDWSGGPGQEIWSDLSKYNLDDGNIENASGNLILKEIATSTFANTGYVISSAFDTGSTTVFNVISWQKEIPESCATCEIRLQIETAPDNGGVPGEWSSSWCGPNGEDGNEDDYYATSTGALISRDHNGDQWIRYKAMLFGDGVYTPILKEVKINYKKK